MDGNPSRGEIVGETEDAAICTMYINSTRACDVGGSIGVWSLCVCGGADRPPYLPTYPPSSLFVRRSF